MIAKRANHVRVQAAAMTWGARGARVNSISPGIVVTPLAQHELNSAIGDGYRAMIAASPSKRMAPPEEIAVAAAYLLGPGRGLHHRQRLVDRWRRDRRDASGQAPRSRVAAILANRRDRRGGVITEIRSST